MHKKQADQSLIFVTFAQEGKPVCADQTKKFFIFVQNANCIPLSECYNKGVSWMKGATYKSGYYVLGAFALPLPSVGGNGGFYGRKIKIRGCL